MKFRVGMMLCGVKGLGCARCIQRGDWEQNSVKRRAGSTGIFTGEEEKASAWEQEEKLPETGDGAKRKKKQ